MQKQTASGKYPIITIPITVALLAQDMLNILDDWIEIST